VTFLASQLRNTKNYSPLPFFVVLYDQLEPDSKRLIWPTVVNELLMTGRQIEHQRLFAKLAGFASELSFDVMKARWRELENMAVIRKQKIADDIFDPELKNAFPLYAVLLETSLRQPIASRVLRSLKTSPPDWLIEAVAPLLQMAKAQHMKFLHAYLSVANYKTFPHGLLVMAGNLVVEQLPELGEEERNEDWVAKTITETSQMQVAGTRELLEKIRSEKKMMVMPKWPASCRRAATETLKNLKRKPLG